MIKKSPFVIIDTVLPAKSKTKGDIQMDENSLAHTKWDCKYHIVFAPKFRRQEIYGAKK